MMKKKYKVNHFISDYFDPKRYDILEATKVEFIGNSVIFWDEHKLVKAFVNKWIEIEEIEDKFK